MKKIFEYFYVFSKFTFSFTLLICLIGALYILYINYKKESKISFDQLSFEKELKENINLNSELINKVVNEIEVNKISLSEIKKNIESISIQNNNKNILNLNKKIEMLNNSFDILSEEIQAIRKDTNISLLSNNKADKSDIIKKNKNDIIDLILVKYQNNIKFNEELDYLRKVISNDKLSKIDKISILSNTPYKGHEYLKATFNEEVNIHLKKILNKNPDSYFSKIILPYIEISPTSENIITNDLILKIKEIQLNIENGNFDNALKKLKTIKDYQNNFKLSSLEISKYLNFKNELLHLR